MALKAACGSFIVYYCLISVVFPSTAFLLTPMCGLMLLLVIIDIVKKGDFTLEDVTLPIAFWLAFGIISFVSSIFTANDVSLALDSALTFIKLTLMCFCVVYISKETDDYEYIIIIMYLISLIYAVYMLMKGSYRGIRLTIGNANSDANVCLIGIVTASWINSQKKNKLLLIFLLITVVLLGNVNLMTGSRKSFVCLSLYLIGWILIELRPMWKYGDLFSKLFGLIMLVIISILIYRFVIPIILNSNTYARIISNSAYDENEIRINLYREAWEYFKKSPIFGIGYNQFRMYNSKGLYSHSTYAEIASNCGIVGIILYFTPHIWSVINLMELNKSFYNEKKEELNSLILLYLISTFILATGMIQTNNERVLLMYALIFSYIVCSKNRIRYNSEIERAIQPQKSKFKYIK